MHCGATGALESRPDSNTGQQRHSADENELTMLLRQICSLCSDRRKGRSKLVGEAVTSERFASGTGVRSREEAIRRAVGRAQGARALVVESPRWKVTACGAITNEGIPSWLRNNAQRKREGSRLSKRARRSLAELCRTEVGDLAAQRRFILLYSQSPCLYSLLNAQLRSQDEVSAQIHWQRRFPTVEMLTRSAESL